MKMKLKAVLLSIISTASFIRRIFAKRSLNTMMVTLTSATHETSSCFSTLSRIFVVSPVAVRSAILPSPIMARTPLTHIGIFLSSRIQMSSTPTFKMLLKLAHPLSHASVLGFYLKCGNMALLIPNVSKSQFRPTLVRTLTLLLTFRRLYLRSQIIETITLTILEKFYRKRILRMISDKATGRDLKILHQQISEAIALLIPYGGHFMILGYQVSLMSVASLLKLHFNYMKNCSSISQDIPIRTAG